MDRVTQQNAALVEESASAAASLEEQASHLNQAVAVFRIEMLREEEPVVATPVTTSRPASAVVPPSKAKAADDSDNWETF